MSGAELREMREGAGVRLWQLAKELDRQESTLSLIERGIRAMPEDLPALYRAALQSIHDRRGDSLAEVSR